MTQAQYREIAKSLTHISGVYYRTQQPPTFDQLIDMVEQANWALDDVFKHCDGLTICAVVRQMLFTNSSAWQVCSQI